MIAGIIRAAFGRCLAVTLRVFTDSIDHRSESENTVFKKERLESTVVLEPGNVGFCLQLRI